MISFSSSHASESCCRALSIKLQFLVVSESRVEHDCLHWIRDLCFDLKRFIQSSFLQKLKMLLNFFCALKTVQLLDLSYNLPLVLHKAATITVKLQVHLTS